MVLVYRVVAQRSKALGLGPRITAGSNPVYPTNLKQLREVEELLFMQFDITSPGDIR